MSSTVAPDLQDRIQTISDAFAALDESRVAGGSDPTFVLDQRDIEDQLERMCAYRVPMDEAVRTVVRKACTDADLDRDDLTDDLAKLAGYGGRPQKATRTMLNSIDEADKWVDVVAEVAVCEILTSRWLASSSPERSSRPGAAWLRAAGCSRAKDRCQGHQRYRTHLSRSRPLSARSGGCARRRSRRARQEE
jgi:hypothetical protein